MEMKEQIQYPKQIHNRPDEFYPDLLHINLCPLGIGKPTSVLWTSSLIEDDEEEPVYPNTGWREWCSMEQWPYFGKHYEIVPSGGARIFRFYEHFCHIVDINGNELVSHDDIMRGIHSCLVNDPDNIPHVSHIVWVALQDEYNVDIVHLTENGVLGSKRSWTLSSTHDFYSSIIMGFNAWDCESSAWLNPAAIIDVKEIMPNERV
jgi:hypothetical protein